MPEIKIKPAVLNITATQGDKYNLLFNNKVAGVITPITGSYAFYARRKGTTVNAAELTTAPNIVITGSQLLIKMDTVLALPVGEYDIELHHLEIAERPEVAGTLIIKASLKPTV